MKNRIIKNLTSLIFGRGLELLLNFFVITLMARYMGTDDYGIFSSIVALVIILSKFIDLGFSQIVFRELSNQSEKFVFLNTSISIRLILFLGLVLGYNVYAMLFDISVYEISLYNILFLNIIISFKFRNIRELLEVPFKVALKTNYIILANVVDNIILLILVFVIAIGEPTVLEFVIIYVLSNLPGFLLLLILLARKFSYKYQFTLINSKWLIRESIPLAGASILITLFLQLDVILLNNFISPFHAGIYSAALRIAIPLAIIPQALITTVFPFITKSISSNQEKVIVATKIVYKSLLLFSVLSAIFISFNSKSIILLVYGDEFSGASETLIWIFWAFVFFYLNNMSQNLLTIYQKQGKNFIYSLIIVIIDISVLFFILFETASVGAGIARLVSAIVGFLYLILMLRKNNAFTNFISFQVMTWIFSVVLLGYLLTPLNLFLSVFLYGSISTALVIVTKYYSKTELILIDEILKQPKWMSRILKW